jgi:hypothetical protein
MAIVNGSSPVAHAALQIRKVDPVVFARATGAIVFGPKRALDQTRARSTSPAPRVRSSRFAIRRARGVVFQQVVIIEIRAEASFDNEGREFVDQQIALAVVEMTFRAFIDQGFESDVLVPSGNARFCERDSIKSKTSP